MTDIPAEVMAWPATAVKSCKPRRCSEIAEEIRSELIIYDKRSLADWACAQRGRSACSEHATRQQCAAYLMDAIRSLRTPWG